MSAIIKIYKANFGCWIVLASIGLFSCQCNTIKKNKTEVSNDSFAGSKAGDGCVIVGINLNWCPPGNFRMGSPPDEPERRPDEEQVDVILTNGFWMGKYEVSQGQWKQVIGKLPGALTVEGGEGDSIPVYNVNYAEADSFCRRLTELGYSSGKLPKGWEFRLPTEAQWEYACRAGTTTATAFGDKISSKEANFNGKPYNGAEVGPALHRATKIGSYAPNAWGIHDMHGNQVEWCRDWYYFKLPGGKDPDLSKQEGTNNRDGTYSRSVGVVHGSMMVGFADAPSAKNLNRRDDMIILASALLLLKSNKRSD